MKRRSFLKTSAASAIASFAFATMTLAENPILKIGFVGVTSGPAAAWGTSNQRSMETRAAWINETGGVKIGDTTYDIVMGRAAGVSTLAVTWGYHAERALAAERPDRIVGTVRGIPAALADLWERT